MTNNIYSILRAYFQYQSDIGIDDIVFDHGSEIKSILTAGTPALNARAIQSGLRQPSAKAGGHGYPTAATPQSSTRPAASGHQYTAGRVDNSAPLSKLSRIKTVDALDVKRVAPVSAPAPVVNTAKREKLAGLYREAINCAKCQISQSRAKVIFGTGSADGKIFVTGDCPCPQDEAAGLPFQGDRGELFGKILEKMGLDRKLDIFATYLQKCRDGGDNGGGINRECAGVCKSILDKQIEIIDPKAILVFGQQAANIILGNDDDIEKLRSADHTYMNKPLIATYSLSLMSEEPQYRRGAWDDMKKILDRHL